MDALVAVKRGIPGAELPALRPRRVKAAGRPDLTAPEDMPERSDVSVDVPVPAPPFWGSRVVKGIHLQEYAALLDERATFMGQWGLKSSRASDGPSYEELVETEGRPRLRAWLERLHAEKMLEAAVVYGYFPVVSRVTTWSCSSPRTSTPPSGTGSRSPGSGTGGTCAWPTSSGPVPRARSTCSGCSS